MNNACADPQDETGIYGSFDGNEQNYSLVEPTWSGGLNHVINGWKRNLSIY